MNAQQEMIRQLLSKVKDASATAEECDQLLQLINSEQSGWVISCMNEFYEAQQLGFEDGGNEQWKTLFRNIVDIDKEETISAATAPLRFINWRRWCAAACFIALAGIGIYLYLQSQHKNVPVVAKTTPTDIPAPQQNRATVTLSDGRTILLDSSVNGQLALQGDIKLVKLSNGQFAYQKGNGEIQQTIQYNTLTNPRGSRVMDITLADGSRVWLNAGSSITYPVAFVSESRTVELKGEGYFDVAKDSRKPFKVKTGSMEVEVLGTQFNINAYNDEPIIKTTLIQGAVNVSVGDQQQRLLPGQQAQVNENKQLKLLKQSDMEVELAWKNNEFNFKYLTDLKTVFRQLARWYDLEISYETGAPENLQFKGAIPMDATLSQVLDALQTTGVRFRRDGQKITVLP